MIRRYLRSYQIEILDRLKDRSALSAPTGTGKSWIGMTWANERGSGIVSTKTVNLQNQYMRDFSDLKPVYHKSRYICPVLEDYADPAPCDYEYSIDECHLKNKCPYVESRIAWSSSWAVTNHAYLVRRSLFSDSVSRPVVIDEAHTLEDVIVESLSFSEDEVIKSLEEIRLSAENGLWSSYWRDKFELIRKEISLETNPILSYYKSVSMLLGFTENLNESPEVKRIRKLIDENLYSKVKWYLNNKDYYVFVDDTYVMIEVSKVFDKIVPSSVPVLMMSATLNKYHLETLGFDGEFVETSPPYKINNEIFYIPLIKMNKGVVESDLDKLTETIDYILDLEANHSGIIHTVSYWLGEAIYEKSRHKDKMILPRNTDELNRVLNKGFKILLSPAITEGIDLGFDKSRFQIIPKIPFPHLGDPKNKARLKKFGTNWIRSKAATTLVQALGRSVRGPDDWARSYILDKNFDMIKSLLPSWMKRNITYVD